MNDISKWLTKLVFYLMAVVLFAWTASLTVSFVSSALPNSPWFVPYFALVVFDLGMIAWLYVFLKHAEGTIQRGIALAACAFDFIGVGLMVMAEILLGGQSLTAAPATLGAWAIWGIGIWTVFNVAAVLIFHIGDPQAQLQMSLQNEQDAITRQALENLAARRKQHSADLANQLGGRMYETLLDRLLVDANKNGRPDILEGNQQLPPLTEEQERRIAKEFDETARPTSSPSVNGTPNGSPSRRVYITQRVKPMKLGKRQSTGGNGYTPE